MVVVTTKALCRCIYQPLIIYRVTWRSCDDDNNGKFLYWFKSRISIAYLHQQQQLQVCQTHKITHTNTHTPLKRTYIMGEGWQRNGISWATTATASWVQYGKCWVNFRPFDGRNRAIFMKCACRQLKSSD